MNALKVNVVHEGVTYSADVMTIESTRLGIEDHGIMSAMLHCKGDGGGTGVGGYGLDQYDKEKGRRVGHAFGLQWLMQVMATVGVERWEKLPGSRVLVLYPHSESHIHLGQIAVGIANVDTGKALIFRELAAAWFPSEERP